jgi:hypothetical protein
MMTTNDTAIDQVIDLIESHRIVLVAPQPATRTAVEAMLPQRHRITDAVDRVIAYAGRLIGDVPAGSSFAGARGTAVDNQRHLMFDVGEGVDLLVQLRFDGAHLHLSGQVLADAPTADVALVGDHGATTAVVDEFGEFETVLDTTTALRLDLTVSGTRRAVDLTPYLDPARSPDDVPSRT